MPTTSWSPCAPSEVLRLVVTDDGIGLPEDVQESGLRNIRERATKLGGTCTIESSPGEGTTVTWTVPLG